MKVKAPSFFSTPALCWGAWRAGLCSLVQHRVEQGGTLSSTSSCSWLTSLLLPAPQLSLLTERTCLPILLALAAAQPILAQHRVLRHTLARAGHSDVQTIYETKTVWSYQAIDIVKTDSFYRQVAGEFAAIDSTKEEGDEEEKILHLLFSLFL